MSTLTVESVERLRPERFGQPERETVTASANPDDRCPVRAVQFVMPVGSLRVGDEVTVEITAVGVVIGGG